MAARKTPPCICVRSRTCTKSSFETATVTRESSSSTTIRGVAPAAMGDTAAGVKSTCCMPAAYDRLPPETVYSARPTIRTSAAISIATIEARDI